ncbi:alpha/beta hydrolase-fold protein [Kitasatospora sp. NPDC049285]|uniref:alpha/beta hydrolase n=1 Tax=Kitasatospora sp. NPDC049285 TaxID=3157096 RepID=UPI003433DF27
MDFSLLSGWLPWTLRILALAAVVASAWRLDRSWLRKRLPWAVAGAILVTALAAALVAAFADIQDPLPIGLWFWICCALLAPGTLALGLRHARWWNMAAVPVAAALAVVCAANALNTSTGYYPNVNDALADFAGAPVPQQMTLDQALTTVGKATEGRVVAVDIPAVPSGFQHRQELVYLPPAWFRSKTRPKLPVVEMIGGQFMAPSNWVRAGDATKTADAYAADHDGFAPVMVFVDATGGFKADTECVNGAGGKAEDHLTKDIPPFVAKTFGTASGPRSWAVAGWSMGGTCAVDLAVVHPDVFGHFVGISGDVGPNMGNKQNTIAQLYGGDAAAWAAHDPLTVLGAKKHDYSASSGLFMAADSEAGHIANAKELDRAARAAGLATKVEIHPGGHDWQFGAFAFKQALPWLVQELGLRGTTG